MNVCAYACMVSVSCGWQFCSSLCEGSTSDSQCPPSVEAFDTQHSSCAPLNKRKEGHNIITYMYMYIHVKARQMESLKTLSYISKKRAELP